MYPPSRWPGRRLRGTDRSPAGIRMMWACRAPPQGPRSGTRRRCVRHPPGCPKVRPAERRPNPPWQTPERIERGTRRRAKQTLHTCASTYPLGLSIASATAHLDRAKRVPLGLVYINLNLFSATSEQACAHPVRGMQRRPGRPGRLSVARDCRAWSTSASRRDPYGSLNTRVSARRSLHGTQRRCKTVSRSPQPWGPCSSGLRARQRTSRPRCCHGRSARQASKPSDGSSNTRRTGGSSHSRPSARIRCPSPSCPSRERSGRAPASDPPTRTSQRRHRW